MLIAEMCRILERSGRLLIYVWAKDQRRENNQLSTYLKQNKANFKPGRMLCTCVYCTSSLLTSCRTRPILSKVECGVGTVYCTSSLLTSS
jgi:hypothetical protein